MYGTHYKYVFTERWLHIQCADLSYMLFLCVDWCVNTKSSQMRTSLKMWYLLLKVCVKSIKYPNINLTKCEWLLFFISPRKNYLSINIQGDNITFHHLLVLLLGWVLPATGYYNLSKCHLLASNCGQHQFSLSAQHHLPIW